MQKQELIKNLLKEETKYSKYYLLIIEKAKLENRKKLKKNHKDYIYYENHHILPKSIFKEYKNLKDNPWNGVLLTAKEHFICHILIYKHYKKSDMKKQEWQMFNAINKMMFSNKYQIRYTSNTYQYLKNKTVNINSINKMAAFNNITKKIVYISTEEYYNNHIYSHPCENTVPYKNIITGETGRIDKEEFINNPNLVSTNKNRINLKDEEGNLINISKDDERYLNGELVNYHLGMKRSDESKKKMSKFQKSFHSENVLVKIDSENVFISRNDTRYLNGELESAFKGRPAHNKGIPMSEEQKIKLSESKKGKPGKSKGRKWLYSITGERFFEFIENKEKLNLYTLKELKQLGINIETSSKERNKGKIGFYDINGKRKFKYIKEEGLFTREEALIMGII